MENSLPSYSLVMSAPCPSRNPHRVELATFWLSAAAYLARIILMNMTVPVYQAFVMEKVDEHARATVASLFSMSMTLGWVVSPTVSGRLQVETGFSTIFIIAISAYLLAIYLYWRSFGRVVPAAAG